MHYRLLCLIWQWHDISLTSGTGWFLGSRGRGSPDTEWHMAYPGMRPSWKTLCCPPESISCFPHRVLEFPVLCPEILRLTERLTITTWLAIQIGVRASNPYCGMKAVMGGSNLLYHWHFLKLQRSHSVGSLKVVPEGDFKCQLQVSEVNTYGAHVASVQTMFSREVIWMVCDVVVTDQRLH